MIGRNILANALGGSWLAILSLLIIPIQIRILGVDAFGLLAFIASLQVIFSIFDLGLSPTITREVAIDTSPDLGHSRDLVQTLSAGYGAIGVALGGTLIVSADWLANHWLKLGALPVDTARLVLQLSGLALMLRWPVSFLSGVLVGRGRFDILNLLKAGTATFGLLGGALVILAFANLVIFAAWMALAALVEVTLYLIACFRLVPELSLRPRLSGQALARIWHYARDLGLVNFLGIALTQSDRLLLSALAPIGVLGSYSLAYNVVVGLTLVQGFITSALFPAFATRYEQGETEKLSSDYNRATQGLVYVYTLPIAALVFFGEPLLRIWTSAETAAPAAPILSVLAPGFLLAASMSVPYTLTLATGNTDTVVRVFLVGLLVYLPLLYLAILNWGGVGAAAAWLLLNIAYVVALLPLVQRRIEGQRTKDWIGRNLLPFLLVGTLLFGIARGILTIAGWHGDIAIWAACAAATLTYILFGLRLLDPALRRQLWTLLKQLTVAPSRAS